MNADHINQILKAFDACPLFEIFTIAEKTQLARQSHIVPFKENQEVFSFEHRFILNRKTRTTLFRKFCWFVMTPETWR